MPVVMSGDMDWLSWQTCPLFCACCMGCPPICIATSNHTSDAHFSTMLSAVSSQLLAVMVAATHIHPYSLCVPTSAPTHPVLAHGRSSLGQCWLSKESDALTYIHLFQVVLQYGREGTHDTGSMCVSRLCKSLEPSPGTYAFTVCPFIFPCRLPGVHH